MQHRALRPTTLVALLATILPSGSMSETKRPAIRAESPVLLRAMPELPRPEALEEVTAPASSEVFGRGQGTGALERALGEVTEARETRGKEATHATAVEVQAASSEQEAIPGLAELGGVQDKTRQKSLLEHLGSHLERIVRTRAEALLTPESLRHVTTNPSDYARTLVQTLQDNTLDAVLSAGTRELQSRLPFIRALELRYRAPYGGREDLLEAALTLSLLETEAGALYTQAELLSRNRELGANIGLGYRFDLTEGLQLGINLFYDWLREPDLQRISAGLEAKTPLVDFSVNLYDALDSKTRSQDGNSMI